ncbi:hypothetical protein JZO70_17560 [Enterococcus sp. 669A]|uniref:YcxB-like protein domain-containing protein n=1 Tax=Candidatus Enterococcus moelleringii TaxID=2815325 RepID=A0ABS3LEC3_9ENTE|nr:hypothetical protein [Enterococcus sp. 669A]MBO1307986.1 hypothetical protein [Enterococcus sp. 669A]
MDNNEDRKRPVVFLKDISVRMMTDGKAQLKRSLTLLSIFWLILLLTYGIVVLTGNKEVHLYKIYIVVFALLGAVAANHLLYSKRITLLLYPARQQYVLRLGDKEVKWGQGDIAAIHISTHGDSHTQGFFLGERVDLLINQEYFAFKVNRRKFVDRLYEFEEALAVSFYLERQKTTLKETAPKKITFLKEDKLRYGKSLTKKFLFALLFCFLVVINLVFSFYAISNFGLFGMFAACIVASYVVVLSKYALVALYDALTEIQTTVTFSERTKSLHFSNEKESFRLLLSDITEIKPNFLSVAPMGRAFSSMALKMKLKGEPYMFSTNNDQTRGKLEYFYCWLAIRQLEAEKGEK